MRIRESLLWLFLFVLVGALYSHTLKSPFVFDDQQNIRENPHIRLTELTLQGILDAGFKSFASNRPITNISFALNYYFHQYELAGYHVVNILIHVANGVLLYLFVKVTLRSPVLRCEGEVATWISFSAALLWLIHPIQTQAVTYIVQRGTSLATMFYLSALVLYAYARLIEHKTKKCLLFSGCFLSAVTALGAKEIAVTLPFLLLLYEWYFFQDLRLTVLRRPLFYCLVGVVLVGLLLFAYMATDAWEGLTLPYQKREFTLRERVLTELRVVVFYIKLLLFPHPSQLNLDHDFLISRSLLHPLSTLFSASGIAGCLGLALYLMKKERLISFCVLWFFAHLGLESSVIALELIFEHRLYLPSMLLGLLVSTLAYRLINPAWLKVALLGAMVVVYSLWTYERNSVWGDEVVFWRDAVEKSPHKARPHSNLGTALLRQGHLEEALAHYAEAIRIDPKFKEVMHNRLGHTLLQRGHLEEAARQYMEALRANPRSAKTRSNLGSTLLQQGRVEEALVQYAEALRLDPHAVEVHTNLSLALLHQGRLEEAAWHATEALRITPHAAEAHHNLGIISQRQGKAQAALYHYAEALRLHPQSAQSRHDLEQALRSLGTSLGAPSPAVRP